MKKEKPVSNEDKSSLLDRCIDSARWTPGRLTEEIALRVVHRRKEGRDVSA